MDADAKLVAAYRDLLSSDRKFAALGEKFGDDAERQPAWFTADYRRDQALKHLANTRAKSPQAIRAKAQALRQPDLEYSHYYAAIAASLADDVLRYFSRAA